MFWTDVLFRFRQRIRAIPTLGKEDLGQGLQTLFPGDGGPGPAFLLIGPIEVLQFREGFGLVQGLAQGLCQFPLTVNGSTDGLPAFTQRAKVLQSLGQCPEQGIVHGPMELLSITGDKGNGIALIQQVDDVCDVLGLLIQFLGQKLNDIVHR